MRIFSTSGEALECVEIARQIGSAVEAGVPFDEIAVLLRSPERHQPLVDRGAAAGGGSRACTAGSWRPDAAGRSFLALLHCAEERLSASRFAEYLSLGQMPEEEGARHPAVWERLLVDAAVIGGPERWATRLGGLREELQRRYREEQDEGAERRRNGEWNGAGQAEGDGAADDRTAWRRCPAERYGASGSTALGELAEFTLREPERVVEYLEELEPMRDIGPVGLGEVLLVSGAAAECVELGAGRNRGTAKCGWERSKRRAGWRSGRVFVPGVNEGSVSAAAGRGSAAARSAARGIGMTLRAEETELLRMAVACATERLTISFSRLDLLTGRERVPSFYAFEAQRAAGGRETDVREFEQRARAATGTRIGWPAPAEAEDAIDDAEFDLATLAPLDRGRGSI